MIKEVHGVNRRRLAGRAFITVDSIAGYCMVSRSTVGRWIRDGKLRAMKLPSGHFRVTVSDFRDFLRRHSMPVTQELIDS
jgi:excisionase family DNA binding protein